MGDTKNKEVSYYSQFEQDKYLAENLFLDQKDGCFIEIGAGDGVDLSNSKYFEDIGWSKIICVEPQPELFQQLYKNRPGSICLNCVISNSTQKKLKFWQVAGYANLLSGLPDKYNPSHINRIKNEIAEHGGKIKEIEVDNFKFNDIIRVKDIDVLSIDTEGNELEILESINWDFYNIKAVLYENNYNDQKPRNLLSRVGYGYLENFVCDELWLKQ